MLFQACQLLIGLTFIGTSFGSRVSSSNASKIIDSQVLESPYPYDFPVLQNGALADSGLFPMPSCHGFTLEEATIDQLQAALSAGRLTSVKLAHCYLRRIYQTDGYIR